MFINFWIKKYMLRPTAHCSSGCWRDLLIQYQATNIQCLSASEIKLYKLYSNGWSNIFIFCNRLHFVYNNRNEVLWTVTKLAGETKHFFSQVIQLWLLFRSLDSISGGCYLSTPVVHLVLFSNRLFFHGTGYRLVECLSMDCFVLYDETDWKINWNWTWKTNYKRYQKSKF